MKIVEYDARRNVNFQAVVVSEQSRHPIYAVRRLVTGVAKVMKI
jgi:hypothetical protein